MVSDKTREGRIHRRFPPFPLVPAIHLPAAYPGGFRVYKCSGRIQPDSEALPVIGVETGMRGLSTVTHNKARAAPMEINSAP